MDPGQTIGRYRIENKLGAGGMGEVYRAWDTVLERWVALKVVPKTQAQLAARLLGEARAAAALHHSNIVSVFDVGEDDAYAFVSMDLVEGRPLRDYVTDPSASQEQKRAWLLQIASALRVAHKAGIVHRDIKPDNVMVSHDGAAHVLDFGLAKSFTVDVQAPTAHESSPTPQFLTGEGRVSGTPAYMAPEQLAGGPPSPGWDQYAWGVLACELLTGQHPRVAGLLSVSGKVKPESLAHVPPELAQIVTRAMAPTPEQRFASMEDVVAALGGPPATTSSPRVGASAPPKPLSTPGGATAENLAIGDTLQVPVHPNAPVQPRPRTGLGVLAVVAVAAIVGSLAAVRLSHHAVGAAPAIPSVTASTPVIPSPSEAPPASVALPAASSAHPPPGPATTHTAVVALPPRKLVVQMRANPTFQYEQASIERILRPMRPLVQSCVDQTPPRKTPATIGIDLELWSVGDEQGKVRDVRVHEPQALASCLSDALMPLAFGPGKNPAMPPGAVFVVVDVQTR